MASPARSIRRPASAQAVVREVLRFLGTTEGFSLIPIEVPGPDAARAVARWIGEGGHPVRVLAPVKDEEWRALAGQLLRVDSGPYGAAMVVGAGPSTPGRLEALFLVNQRRDQVMAGLEGPLLWVGTRDFLQETWRAAPDFWSVRGLGWRVAPHATRTDPRFAWSGPLVDDDPDRFVALRDEARAQGDGLNAARMGYLLAGALASRAAFAEARAALAEARTDLRGDADLAFDVAIFDARLAMLVGTTREVTARLAEARELAGESPGKLAQIDLVRARRLLARGLYPQAERLLADVAGRCRAARPFLAARALTMYGRLLRRGATRAPERLEAAEKALREGLDLFQGLGEALGAANVLVELGDLARQAGRSAEAEPLYRGALATYREHGARDAARRVRLKLARSGRARG